MHGVACTCTHAWIDDACTYPTTSAILCLLLIGLCHFQLLHAYPTVSVVLRRKVPAVNLPFSISPGPLFSRFCYLALYMSRTSSHLIAALPSSSKWLSGVGHRRQTVAPALIQCLCVVQVICAGSLDTFQVYVWSVRTGRLLDVLAGHEGPVAGLAFSPTQSLLASASWDKTVRTWDVFRSVTHTYFPCTWLLQFALVPAAAKRADQRSMSAYDCNC